MDAATLNGSLNLFHSNKYALKEGNTLDVLKTLPDDCCNLVITSPPYNLGKEYETRESIDSYLEKQRKVIGQLVRVTSNNGHICWQVGNYIQNGEVFPLDIYYYSIFKDFGLKLRNRIVWRFGHGLHASHRFSGRYETILWFSKSDEYVFNLDSVRVPAKYPGKRHFKGPKRGQLSGNPKGKNPSDVWDIVVKDWENEVWDIPNVKSNHPEKTTHPCQFPVELVERCILALTDENSWILDPYVGVGSSVIAALKHNRNAIGIDKEKEYIDLAKQRVASLHEGTLKLRPVNKPIHQPKAGDKLAQLPKEWQKPQAK